MSARYTASTISVISTTFANDRSMRSSFFVLLRLPRRSSFETTPGREPSKVPITNPHIQIGLATDPALRAAAFTGQPREPRRRPPAMACGSGSSSARHDPAWR